MIYLLLIVRIVLKRRGNRSVRKPRCVDVIRFIHPRVHHTHRNVCSDACCPLLSFAMPHNRGLDRATRNSLPCSEVSTRPICLGYQSPVMHSFTIFIPINNNERKRSTILHCSKKLDVHLSHYLNQVGDLDILMLCDLHVPAVNEK